MKIGQTAKSIDAIVNPKDRYNYNRPIYFGMGMCWNDKKDKWDKVTSTYIAQRYSKIVDMVKDTKAAVKIEGKLLKIIYSTGSANITIDELVKKILIPELKPYIVTMD